VTSTFTVKSRAAPVCTSPRFTTCAIFGSRASCHETVSAPPGAFGVTRVQRTTRSASGSPLATPWRKTGSED
jgi:hypothetical protein